MKKEQPTDSEPPQIEELKKTAETPRKDEAALPESADHLPDEPEKPELPAGKRGETDAEKTKTKKLVLIISIAASVVLLGIILAGILFLKKASDANSNTAADDSFHVSRETATPTSKVTTFDDDFLDAMQQSVTRTMEAEAEGADIFAISELLQDELDDLEAFRNKSFSDDNLRKYMENYLIGMETQIDSVQLYDETPSEFQIQWQTGLVERCEALSGLYEEYGFMKSSTEFNEHYIAALASAVVELTALWEIEDDIHDQTHDSDADFYYLDGRKFYFELTNHTSYTFDTVFKFTLYDPDDVVYFEESVVIEDIEPNDIYEVAVYVPSASRFRAGHWHWTNYYANIDD